MNSFVYFFVFLSLVGAGCQKKPVLAPAADPFSALSPPPMGASTYNDELKKELLQLDKLLNNKLDPKKLGAVKDALMAGSLKGSWAQNSDEDYLARVLLALPELVHSKEALTPTRMLWYKSKLLFLRRRFIEAASGMSEVLKAEPLMSTARNWRARAIFFLGNPDMAIKELQIITTQEAPSSEAYLDALYLIGAIVYESHEDQKKQLSVGIKAWEKYLKISDPDIHLKEEINKSLAELKQKLTSENQAPTLVADIFLPSEKYDSRKNTILQSFIEDNLILSEKLCNEFLAKKYDKDLAIIKARIYIKSGRIDEAALLFDKITEKDKNYAPGFHYRGMAYMMKGLIEEAIQSWQQTLKLDNAYAISHNLPQRISVAQNMLKQE